MDGAGLCRLTGQLGQSSAVDCFQGLEGGSSGLDSVLGRKWQNKGKVATEQDY